MKKLLRGLVVGSLFMISAHADYKLILTDKDGVQTEQCIKSYSFSNNLESIAKQKGVGDDIYEKEETLTNKVYMGKPVYRIISTIPPLSASNTWPTTRNYNNPPSNVDTFISAVLVGAEEYGHTNKDATSSYQLKFKLYADKVLYSIGSTRTYLLSNRKVIVEYTKTTDTASTTTNEFKSYLHYIPSNSTTEDVITKDMKNLGVQFLEDYYYDSNTNMCNPISN